MTAAEETSEASRLLQRFCHLATEEEQTPTGFVSGLVTNTSSPNLAQCLARSLNTAQDVSVATAFLNASATNPLILPLQRLLARGGRVRLLTSLMNWFNRPEALNAFASMHPNLELRVYAGDETDLERFVRQPPSFHLKAYLFQQADHKKQKSESVLVIGSANLTTAGLSGNVEWAYISAFEANIPLQNGVCPFTTALAEYDRMWNEGSLPLSQALLERYATVYQQKPPSKHPLATAPVRMRETVQPNAAQKHALEALKALRNQGERKAAVIAATGVGKTYLAALDVKEAQARRILFLAHRETILRNAEEALASVLDTENVIVLQGSEALKNCKETSDIVVLSMVQTLSRSQVLEFFPEDYFDYIVLDEFHHSAAPTYRRILNYFQPRFLLGLTATPERTDGQDVLAFCDYNVAYEIRLLEAIDQGLLSPFHYYALHDPTDYSQIRWTGTGYDENQLEQHLSQDTRAGLIINNLHRFQPETGKRKCLAFCSNIGHARWMCKTFNKGGLLTDTVLGDTPNEERHVLIKRLEDPEDPLEIICCVDVFSEGVDIPALTHVLMLRPTLSFTVFLQQLGRGLRPAPNKPFATVLDFVGNYRRSYVAPLALQGHYTSALKTSPSAHPAAFHPPQGCHVDADQKVQEVWQGQLRQIIAQLSPLERLRMALEDLAQNPADGGGQNSIEAIEPVALASQENFDQVHRDLKNVGGWLQLRIQLNIASDHEINLQGTEGEHFLKYIEQELKPQKSYKMTILRCLIDFGDEKSWEIDDLASCFLKSYLSSKHKMQDWKDLYKSRNPKNFSVSKTKKHIKNMPLMYLSNTESDYFVLDGPKDMFYLKKSVHPFWEDTRFRNEVEKRIAYAEALYWWRIRKFTHIERR